NLPVALAVRIGLQRNRGFDDGQVDDLETALQQGQQRDLRLDSSCGKHLRRLRPARVAKRDVVDRQGRLQRQLEIDAALDGELPAGRFLYALRNGSGEVVDVDGAYRNRDSDDQQEQEARQSGQDSPEQAH